MKKKWHPDNDPTWENELKDVLEEAGKDHFGHNVEIDGKKYFRKLHSLSAGYAGVSIEDDYTAKIDLSYMNAVDPMYRNNVLMYILTTAPLPSECRYNKNKDMLTLEWHY